MPNHQTQGVRRYGWIIKQLVVPRIETVRISNRIGVELKFGRLSARTSLCERPDHYTTCVRHFTS